MTFPVNCLHNRRIDRFNCAALLAPVSELQQDNKPIKTKGFYIVKQNEDFYISPDSDVIGLKIEGETSVEQSFVPGQIYSLSSSEEYRGTRNGREFILNLENVRKQFDVSEIISL